VTVSYTGFVNGDKPTCSMVLPERFWTAVPDPTASDRAFTNSPSVWATLNASTLPLLVRRNLHAALFRSADARQSSSVTVMTRADSMAPPTQNSPSNTAACQWPRHQPAERPARRLAPWLTLQARCTYPITVCQGTLLISDH